MNNIKKLVAIALIILAAFGGFMLGSRISEVKISLIDSLDDMSSLIVLKRDLKSDDSKILYEKLKDRCIWRYEGLRHAYETSNFKHLIRIDRDIDLGFSLVEKRKKDL